MDYSVHMYYSSKAYRQQQHYKAACRAGRKFLWIYYGLDPKRKD